MKRRVLFTASVVITFAWPVSLVSAAEFTESPYRVAVTAVIETAEDDPDAIDRPRLGRLISSGLARRFAPAVVVERVAFGPSPAAGAVDKSFGVDIAVVGATASVAVTEHAFPFDDRSAPVSAAIRLGPVDAAERRLADAAAALVARAFRPVAVIEPDGRDRVRLTPRAARLRPADDSIVTLAGGHFRSFLVTPGRDDEPSASRPIDATYLIADAESAGPGVSAAVLSPFAGPFLRSRGRSRFVALAVGPRFDGTTLEVRFAGTPTAFGPAETPAAGREVTLQPTEGDSPAAETRLLDRDGRLFLPTGDPVRVTLRSSGRVLADRPILPGAVDRVVWTFPSDRPEADFRLAVDAIESSLVETVARRTVLVRRTNAALDAGRIDRADSLLAEANRLPTTAATLRRLDAAAAVAADAAGEAGNARAAARIDRERRRVAGTVERFLDDRALSDLRERIETARDLAAD